MTPASLIDRAVVFVNGQAISVVTGTSFTVSDDGDLIVAPPAQRVAFVDGRQVPQEPGMVRLFRRDGTVVESPAGTEGRA